MDDLLEFSTTFSGHFHFDPFPEKLTRVVLSQLCGSDKSNFKGHDCTLHYICSVYRPSAQVGRYLDAVLYEERVARLSSVQFS